MALRTFSYNRKVNMLLNNKKLIISLLFGQKSNLYNATGIILSVYHVVGPIFAY